MKVLNLKCIAEHSFEGWFASEDDYVSQSQRGLVECPLCGDKAVLRMPSAPRLNISGARAPASAQAEPAPLTVGAANADVTNSPQALELMQQMQTLWLRTMREVVNRTEDVGERFPEEARKIHYGEAEVRGIRGVATPQQRAELSEEGIEVMPLPLPAALKGPAH